MRKLFFTSLQEILNRTKSKQYIPWFKSLKSYYFRPEWELYDLKHDPEEVRNLIGKQSMNSTFEELRKQLFDWQLKTKDPWICAPHAVLENKGNFKENPQCLDLYNIE